MSSFDDNRKAKEERKDKDKTRKETLAKYLYDLSKVFLLVYSSVALPAYSQKTM